MADDPADLLPLPPATLNVLLALGSRELHGYAIMTEVERLSDGTVRMGPGTLYGTVKRLLEGGLIEECDQRPDEDEDDERRRCYRLNGFGARVLDAEVHRLAQMMRRAGALRLELGTT